LGCDAAALEARIQAHYVYPFRGGKELADMLLNGDIHQANADMWGVERNEAKSPYYCLMYGGQPHKLSQTLGCSLPKARRAFNDFWAAYTPLEEFKSTLVKLWEKRGGKNGGYLKGLDGRKLLARSPHSLVNLMIQSAGSIAVKAAVAIADRRIQQLGLDAKQIIVYHDEVEYEVADKDVVKLQQVVEKAFSDSGKLFKLNVELKGEAKVGKSWYEVH
jgi:DNA polymerase I-like protein with 3'-5' exonuclease and polymerase domains